MKNCCGKERHDSVTSILDKKLTHPCYSHIINQQYCQGENLVKISSQMCHLLHHNEIEIYEYNNVVIQLITCFIIFEFYLLWPTKAIKPGLNIVTTY